MNLSRRTFLQRASCITLGFSGLSSVLAQRAMASRGWLTPPTGVGFGPLLPDPRKLLDLPAGFSYDLVIRSGDVMDDGLIRPSLPDGMAAFAGEDGRTVVICNHEIQPGMRLHGPFGKNNELLEKVDPAKVYDLGVEGPSRGGTSTIIYDTRGGQGPGKVERSFMSLAGTERNCAGGPTPWGSWITCEETVIRKGEFCREDHGYCFEVPSSARGLVEPKPILGMGRFMHEACAVDAASGAVYLTEDRGDGLIYRYLPTKPGELHAGGRLQALAVRGRPSFDTGNHERQDVAVGSPLAVEWIDLEDIQSPDDSLRTRGFAKGAARFRRGEGMWAGSDGIYFCCTDGGSRKCGQIWRYRPSAAEGTKDEAEAPGMLELFIEPNDPTVLEHPDNITVSPWGDLVVCEDGTGEQFLVGVTPGGRLYPIARNAASSSEFAGATFSPDGTTLFVNLQGLGLTLAIRGAWGGER